MVKNEMAKRAIIAGASCALTYKEKHPNASEEEVMSHVTEGMREIIRNIEEEK
ncbi:MAG: hypothetical protein AABX28_02025 [Nanoarchaeota archaeon]